MRIHILSDLHIDFGNIAFPKVEADITVIAGDLRPGKAALKWIRENIPERLVVYVMGNHEFYGHAIPKLIHDFRRLSEDTNVHVLENECFYINDICFMGCTLWTDFRLFGDPTVAGRKAVGTMNDYRRIRVSPRYSRLKGIDTATFHARSIRWLKEQLSQNASKTNVIVTHHGPSVKSLKPMQANELISAAYVSNLEGFVASSGAKLWIHGHIHNPVDYWIGNTRIMSNPRGYADEPAPENFDPGLIVEIKE